MKRVATIFNISIAAAATTFFSMPLISSCSSNKTHSDIIPTKYLDIHDSTLYGFTSDWDPTNCSQCTKLVVPSNVMCVAPNAFSGESAQHTIPESINTLSFESDQNTNLLFIGEYAFMGCQSLTTICLPDRLSNVDSRAFKNCSNVSTLDLSEWTTEKYDSSCPFTGTEIFAGWQSAGTIIANTQKRVNLYYMMLNTGLNEDWYNVNFETVKDDTFTYRVADGEKILVQVDSASWKYTQQLNVIPGDVTMIAPKAFRSIWGSAGSGSHTVTLESNSQLKIIYSNAFEGDSYNFVKIDLSQAKNLKSIDNSAFSDCSHLSEVVLPKESPLQSIGANCFHNCYDLQKFSDASGKVTKIDVRSIGDSAFYACRSLTTLSVSNIEWVGRKGFYNSAIQGELEIEPSLKYIGDSAFETCLGITKLICNKETSNLMRIGDKAFFGCSSLTGTISLPKSVVYIGEAVFVQTQITDYDIHLDNPYYMNGKSINGDRCIYVKNAEGEADILLAACSETTTIKPTIRRIANYAFANIVLSESTKRLDLSALNKLESIGSHAFESVKRAGDNPKFVVRLSDNESISIGDHCFSSSGISDININSLTGTIEIGSHAFSNCNNLTEIEIPTNISYIPTCAFANCENLTKVIIPSNIKQIGNHAFDQCHNLADLYLTGFTALPEWDDTVESFYCWLKLHDANVHIPSMFEGQTDPWKTLIKDKLKYSGYPSLFDTNIHFLADL